MEPYKSAIERAFELAQSGRFVSISAIRDRLRHEGYSNDRVSGPALVKHLRTLISEARGPCDSSKPASVSESRSA